MTDLERLRNVRVNYAASALFAFADSVWAGTVFSAFVAGTWKDDGTVNLGWAETAYGLTPCALAFFAGYAADRWSRSGTVRIGTFVGLAGLCMTAAGILRGSYPLLLAGQAVWGSNAAFTYGPAQALFADSTPKGSREGFFGTQFVCETLPSVLGPLLGAVYFWTSNSNGWSLGTLKNVFLAGLALELPCLAVLWLYRDVPRKEEEKDDTGSSLWKVPWLLTLSDVLWGFGASASSAFFPLFWKRLGLSPAGTQLVYAAAPLGMVLCSRLALRRIKSGYSSSVRSALAFRLAALAALVAFAMFALWDLPAFCLVPVYLLHLALADGIAPVDEAILMDHVPARTRARWQAFGFAASFGWAAGAALGGYASRNDGFLGACAVSVAFEALGVSVFFLVEKTVEGAERSRRPLLLLQSPP